MSDLDEPGIARALAAFQARAAQHPLLAMQICDVMAIKPLGDFNQAEVEQIMVSGRLRYEEALVAVRLRDHFMELELQKPHAIVDLMCKKLDQVRVCRIWIWWRNQGIHRVCLFS